MPVRAACGRRNEEQWSVDFHVRYDQKNLTQGKDIKLSPDECPVCPNVAEGGSIAFHIKLSAPRIAGTTASSRKEKMTKGTLEDWVKPVAAGGSDMAGTSVSYAEKMGDGEWRVSVYYQK
jgi:hypothetical protein